MQSVATIWEVDEQRLISNAPSIAALRSGAPEEDMDRFQDAIGETLPDDYVRSARCTTVAPIPPCTRSCRYEALQRLHLRSS